MKRKIFIFSLIYLVFVAFYIQTKIEISLIEEGEVYTKGTITEISKGRYVVKTEIGKILIEDENEELDISPGDIVECKMELTDVRFKDNPREFNYELYLISEGYSGYGTISLYKKIGKNHFYYGRHRMLENMHNYLVSKYGEQNGNTVFSMISGNKEGIEEGQYEKYLEVGILHIFAVSGLHFGIIYVFVNRLVMLLIKRKKMSKIISLIAMIIYMLLIGGGYSSLRALLLIVTLEVSKFTNRPFDSVVAIGFVNIIVLASNPFALYLVSYQLSFTAYLSIVLIYPIIRRRIDVFSECKEGKLELLLIKFVKVILLSLVVSYFIYPISVMSFQSFNYFSFITNVPVVFLVSLLLPLAIGQLALSWLPIASDVMAIVCSKLLDLINILVDLSFNLGLVSKVKGNSNVVITLYLLLVLLIVIKINCKEIIGKIKKSNKMLIKINLLLAVILMELMLMKLGSDDLQVLFFNVGHGDSVLVKYLDKTILIDTGDEYFNVEEYLLNLGIEKVDILIISHMHKDHYGNLDGLVKDNIVETVIVPEDIRNAGKIEIGKELHLDLYRNYSQIDENDNGLVVKLKYKKFDVLFTGDMSKKIDENYIFKDVTYEFLKVAHHSSADASSEFFLEENTFVNGVISCSDRYGFPKIETINNLVENGVSYHITKNCGAVLVESDGEKYTVIY